MLQIQYSHFIKTLRIKYESLDMVAITKYAFKKCSIFWLFSYGRSGGDGEISICGSDGGEIIGTRGDDNRVCVGDGEYVELVKRIP